MRQGTAQLRGRVRGLFAIDPVGGHLLKAPAHSVNGRMCWCPHCHGLGCGGWCRWCP